jgi:cell fate regulator YaaT (PSP1 superfamily)
LSDTNTETVESTDQGSVILVKFPYSSETMLCSTHPDSAVAAGDKVVVAGRYGKDIADVLGPVGCNGCGDTPQAFITRKATEQDLDIYCRNLEKEREALQICKDKIAEHKLDMKLVTAHYMLEEPKVLFFFTAESRVDFRALVKDLVSVFKMRIELRQIGVRDESRVLGGLAVCGRAYCCHAITDNLRPVSIKMAKEQNLSLNSMKISGPCGRLLCCLSYEFDLYREEKNKVPQEGARIKIGEELCRVAEVNILAKKVRFSGSEGRSFSVPFSRISRGDDKIWLVDYEPESGE